MKKHVKKLSKNLNSKYRQKFLDTTRKSAADVFKTSSKRVIQETTEATGDVVGDKIAKKMTMIASKNAHKDQNTTANTTNNKNT